MTGKIFFLSLGQRTPILFFSFSEGSEELVFGVSSASAFDPTIIPPCYQQAFGPSFTRITFAAKECALFSVLYACRSCYCWIEVYRTTYHTSLSDMKSFEYFE